MELLIIVLLVLLIVGVLPTWPYSRGWGYGPSGIVAVLLVLLAVLYFAGRL